MAWTAISTRNETPPIARGGWLDALRFIVATMIILHHFQAAGPIPLAESLHPVFERGGFLLTNFFLIDSGYVLMRVYGGAVGRGAMSPGDFFIKRFLRVYPAHLLMGLTLVGLVLATAVFGIGPRHPTWFAWDQLPAQLTLTQAFGIHGGLGWNAPSWSVSALVGCYVLFPYVLRVLKGMGPWGAMAGVILLYLVANEVCRAFLGYPVYQMPMKFGFLRALPLFVLGMGLAVFSEKVFVTPRLARIVGVSAAVGLAVIQWYGKNALISLTFISLIIIAAGAIPVLRPSKLIERASVVSFSMFITNEVVRIAWFGVANVLIVKYALSTEIQWAIWSAGVLAAIGFAFAFHAVIDDPMQTWIKRRLARGKTRRRPIEQGAVVSIEG